MQTEFNAVPQLALDWGVGRVTLVVLAVAGEVLRERVAMSTAERLLVSAALFLGKPVEQGKYRDDSP